MYGEEEACGEEIMYNVVVCDEEVVYNEGVGRGEKVVSSKECETVCGEDIMR